MRILVVDNSKVIRQIICEELTNAGYDVLEADRGAVVYELLQTESIDLVTLSVELPGECGYDICKNLKSDEFIEKIPGQRNIPVLFIAGSETIEERKRGFDAGAAEFIHKPFRSGTVATTVNQILKPEQKLSGLMALVVDDSISARLIVSEVLRQQGVIVIEAKGGQEGYEYVKEHREAVDLVITDLIMPDMSGDELVKLIRGELDQRDLPVIILSGAGSNVSVLDLYKAGATDYIMKPFIKEELLARLLVHLEARLLNKRLMAKIKELEVVNHKLVQMATTDSLTGLPNRKQFFDRFAEAFARKERYGHKLTFIILDIDFFKKVNDTYGHQVGDWLLQEFSDLVAMCVRKTDIVGRMGGEEFGILADETGLKGGAILAEKVRRAVESRKFLKARKMDVGKITTSIGIFTTVPSDGLTIEEIYRRADERLYVAKKSGRNRICWKDESSTQETATDR